MIEGPDVKKLMVKLAKKRAKRATTVAGQRKPRWWKCKGRADIDGWCAKCFCFPFDQPCQVCKSSLVFMGVCVNCERKQKVHK